ncbi:hypothetical protein BHM03_00041995 [Ensete ventricosum]|nr:hypothetical protein BHM03_00041995 [Ensete ventricosum]
MLQHEFEGIDRECVHARACEKTDDLNRCITSPPIGEVKGDRLYALLRSTIALRSTAKEKRVASKGGYIKKKAKTLDNKRIIMHHRPDTTTIDGEMQDNVGPLDHDTPTVDTTRKLQEELQTRTQSSLSLSLEDKADLKRVGLLGP